MKKRWLKAAALLILAGSLTACGSKEAGEMKYLSDFKAKDYVTLGEYKGIETDLKEPEVSDEYLEGYIGYILANNPVTEEITDRGVEDGDIVDLDYEGKVDGETFPGGTAAGSRLTIGSGRFIDGFEEGMIGMKTGETRELDLVFPDPYTRNSELSGKPVVFTVTVNSISVQKIPELTDEYAASLGIEGCANAEDYRKYMYDILTEQLQASFKNEKINAALEIAESNAEFKGVPEGMLNRMNETLTGNITAYAAMYGMDIADYVAQAFGNKEASYQDVILEQARLMAQRYILLAAIAEEEGIEVTDAELEERIAEMAAGYADYGFESEEAYREDMDKEAYREYLLIQKVSDFLGDNVVLGGE